MNVTGTSTVLRDLEPNATYHLFLLAANEHGTSLPSSMLLLNITDTGKLLLRVETCVGRIKVGPSNSQPPRW